MRGWFVPFFRALEALTFAAVFLTASDAFGRSRQQDDIVRQVVTTVRGIPVQNFFIAAAVFLVIGIFAKYQEARGIYVLGSFVVTMACVGVGIVTFLTSDAVDHPHFVEVMGGSVDSPEKDQTPVAVVAAAPAAGAGGIGAECKKQVDCSEGTVCAHVAGSFHCWAPCGANGSCGPGFACMGTGKTSSVCVR